MSPENPAPRETQGSPARYDAAIVGSGQGGTPLAKALAKAGWRTALIERNYVGGSCVNYGCTPSKTMAASARAAYDAGRAGEFGVRVETLGVDMARVRERKREMVKAWREPSEKSLLETENLDLIYGQAKFTAAKSLSIRKNDGGTFQLTAEHIFLDTGTHAAEPSIEGFERVRDLPNVLDNASIMELDRAPEHLIVLGGGYIGVEFAQMFRRFGSRVTVAQRGGQLLAREDADVAEEVAKILREDGIDILLNANAARVEGDAGRIVLELEASAERRLQGTHLLVAIGRTPNTEDLNLAAAGIETEKKGYIRVNARLETSAAGVYAIGDVKGGPAFTHISYDDYRVLRANLLQDPEATAQGVLPATIQGRPVPYAVFIDPQLGRIGITEKEARKQGKDIRVAKLPMASVARARQTGETLGLMKIVVDAESQQFLGAAILGAEGGEIMAMVELAMMGKLRYPMLREGIFAHPTLAESLNNVFGHFEDS